MKIRFELDSNKGGSHFHDDMEVLYVLSGRVTVMVNGMNYALGPEDFSVFNPFESHEIYLGEGAHILSAFISLETLQECEIGRIHCISSVMPERNDYLLLLRIKLAILYKDYSESGKQRELYILSQLYGFLAVLKQHFEAGDAGCKHTSSSMRSVFLYVNRHYTENISLQSTAKELYLSKSYLSREFTKQAGMNFSDYLRNLRLNRAAHLLRTTTDSVTEISMRSGFSNVDTMIVNFRKRYGMTPSAYRSRPAKTHFSPEEAREHVSYVRLLKYAAREEKVQPLNKRETKPAIRAIDLQTRAGMIDKNFVNSMGIGTLDVIFREDVYESIVNAARELGLKYLFFHGILDDHMDVYRESLDGTPKFSYLYVDIAIDKILSAQVKPWVEIGYTPSRLIGQITNEYGNSFVELPTDLNKWAFLVKNILEHWKERYGMEEVRSWRFSVTSILFSAYGLFDRKAYLAYYECTCKCVRSVLPGAPVYGATFDIGILRADGADILKEFLSYCKRRACTPDAISFQAFGGNYALKTKREVEQAILSGNLEIEPVPPDENPDLLWEELTAIRRLLDENACKDVPIIIDTWNSTIWRRDLGNDTCFKAAYVVKNILDTMEYAKGLVYSELVDMLEDDRPFIGAAGLVTRSRLPKSAYYAFALLARLEEILVEKGEGYAVTCSRDRTRFTLLFYNYCHYNMKVHLDRSLSVSDQLTIDRYYGFVDSGVKQFQIHLRGIPTGTYQSEDIIINREHGSSYDRWLQIGAPRELTGCTVDYLRKTSLPEYRYGKTKIDLSGTLLVSAVLDAHEVRTTRFSLLRED